MIGGRLDLTGPGFQPRRHQLLNDLRHGWKPCPFKTSEAGEFFRNLLAFGKFEFNFEHHRGRWTLVHYPHGQIIDV